MRWKGLTDGWRGRSDGWKGPTDHRSMTPLETISGFLFL